LPRDRPTLVPIPAISAAARSEGWGRVGAELGPIIADPDGEIGDWLFVNIQAHGVTFATTGPWRNGAY
jgi:hypothetical protein